VTSTRRALNASAGFTGSYAKICIALDEDVDIHDPATINWAICFSVRLEEDVMVAKGKSSDSIPRHICRAGPSTLISFFSSPITRV
jgi:UbiD family decarboxylase